MGNTITAQWDGTHAHIAHGVGADLGPGSELPKNMHVLAGTLSAVTGDGRD